LLFEKTRGERFCKDVIELDGTIIFAAVGSISGYEIASAWKPSMLTYTGNDKQLKKKYSSLVSIVVNAFKQTEPIFGRATRIVGTFEKNLRVMILPLFDKDMFILVLTTREPDVKILAFQISKVFERFEGQ
jgi:hypothetical protein